MVKRTTLEEREAEKLKGIGKLLNPASGQPLTKAKYSVTRYDEFAETFTGWNKVEGGGKIEVFVTEADLPGLHRGAPDARNEGRTAGHRRLQTGR